MIQLVYKLWRQGQRGSRLALAGLTIDLNHTPDCTDPSTLRAVQPGTDDRGAGGGGGEKPSEITLVDPFAPSTPASALALRHSLQFDMLPPQDPKSPAFPVLLPAVVPPAAVLAPSAILADTRRFSRARFSSASVAESQATRVNSLNQLHSKLHGIILRVSAYPVALVLVNILHTGQQQQPPSLNRMWGATWLI